MSDNSTSTNNGEPQAPIGIVHLEVRDYECDMADGVNNAVYFNYIEHARHQFLKTLGIDFAEYARKKIGLIVLHLEMDFKTSLVSGDKFYIKTTMQRISRIKFQFNQEIYRESDNKLALSATVVGTAVNERNRPEIPEEIERALGAFKPNAETV